MSKTTSMPKQIGLERGRLEVKSQMLANFDKVVLKINFEVFDKNL
jgi:hypothetical protein